MQLKLAVLALFAALASAEKANLEDYASKLPACAKTCVKAGSRRAGCAVDDYKCQCARGNFFLIGCSEHLSQDCSSDDATTMGRLFSNLCMAIAVDITNDVFNSVVHLPAGAASSTFTSVTTALESASTTAADNTATSSTAADDAAFTSGTVAIIDTRSAATHVAAAPVESTPAAAHRAVAGVGMVGAAVILVLAL